MTSEAMGAIVDEAGGPIVVEPILLDEPQADEVQVRIVASGVCHSDLWARDNGNWGMPFRCCSVTKAPASWNRSVTA